MIEYRALTPEQEQRILVLKDKGDKLTTNEIDELQDLYMYKWVFNKIESAKLIKRIVLTPPIVKKEYNSFKESYEHKEISGKIRTDRTKYDSEGHRIYSD